MTKVYKKIIFYFLTIIFVGSPLLVHTQGVNLDANKLVPTVEVYLSPRSGSFMEGSLFEVPVFVNTKGRSINGIEIKINFDKDKLSVIKQSGGTSVVTVWVESPKYDNTNGVVSYIGVVPNGIITDAGLIGTITFKAIKTGEASVTVNQNSSILLNDGLGTNTRLDIRRSNYSIIERPPEGVKVFSETHPFQSSFYNNSSPVIAWDKDLNVKGFSFELDNKPNTIPDNIIDGNDTVKSYENLKDGLWYFHIKANKNGIWGNTGHFLLRIDTTPPAKFKPETQFLLADVSLIDRTLISFITTDNLSGISRYEVGVIDKDKSSTESPAFIQTESPYQVPIKDDTKLRVIVRATDGAGNITDSYVDVKKPSVLMRFIRENLIWILFFIIIIGFVSIVSHYLFGHHIVAHIKRILEFIRKEEEIEIKDDNKN